MVDTTKPQQFEYVVPEVEEGAEPLQLSDLTFFMPGEPNGAYTAAKPKDAVWARASAAASPRMPMQLRVGAILDFFEAALIPEDRVRFRIRFEDPEDALDVKDVVPIILWMAKEWRTELGPASNRTDRRAAGRR